MEGEQLLVFVAGSGRLRAGGGVEAAEEDAGLVAGGANGGRRGRRWPRSGRASGGCELCGRHIQRGRRLRRIGREAPDLVASSPQMAGRAQDDSGAMSRDVVDSEKRA